MSLFPFLYLLLVLLTLQVVALVAQWLQVRPVKESLLTADRPRLDVINAGGGLDDALAVAFRAQGMLGPEGPGQPRPPCGVVGICGALADVAVSLLRSCGMVPR